MTIRAGVVGSPARHSLSPLIHGAWLRAAGIDGEYALYDLAPEGFGAFLDEARAKGLRGVNVTLPFKEQALAAAATATPDAVAAGAANLLIFEDGGLVAHNTDGYGLLRALAEQAPGLDLDGAKVVVLGAGGAARGAVAALAAAGAEVVVVNRTQGRADALIAAVSAASPRPVKLSTASLAMAAPSAGLIINATSAGLNGADDGGFDLSAAPATAVVMDMIYKPLITPLLTQAAARGHRTVDGLAMLIGQARPSFEAFYGAPPPDDVDVRALCLAALGLAVLEPRA